jgi:hypothetical protein
MITDSCIATISKRARATITNPSNVIWVSTKISGCDSTKKQNKTKLQLIIIYSKHYYMLKKIKKKKGLTWP